MKNYERLEGMVAAVFTPMVKNGEVNYAAIDRYADWIASTAINGVFVCGTTGEFSSLTMDERNEILARWVRACKKRFKVIAHVGSNCQKESIALARYAQELGVDATASIAPSFFKPGSVKDLIDFFSPIAAAAPDLPFYYYNMPAMTGVSLPVEVFLQEGKKRIPNLAGTKFTHNNLMEMEVCLTLEDGRFEVLHGYDEILISGLAMGAVAGIGSTYNYIPQIYDGIFNAMKKNDLQTAQKLQQKSIETVEVIIKYGGGVRGGKAIMNLIGIECGDCRSPIKALEKEEQIALENDLSRIGFPDFQ